MANNENRAKALEVVGNLTLALQVVNDLYPVFKDLLNKGAVTVEEQAAIHALAGTIASGEAFAGAEWAKRS